MHNSVPVTCCLTFSYFTFFLSWFVQAIARVDVLIVDEAAQAMEAELAIPLALGCHVAPASGGGRGGGGAANGVRNLVLVGDPKQLPATIMSTRNQRSGRGQSAMQRLMERCGHPSTLLDTQVRPI